MSSNRITAHRWRDLVDRSAAVTASSSYVACPVCVLPPAVAQHWGWQQEMFRLAYEAARVNNVLPQYGERLFSNWN